MEGTKLVNAIIFLIVAPQAINLYQLNKSTSNNDIDNDKQTNLL